MPLRPSDLLLGRYRVDALAGQGGMARVHAATDEATGERVALKELRAGAPELLQAFRDEFAWLVRLTSPFLTRVYDYGTAVVRGESISFYAAEWIEGRTLGEVAKRDLAAALRALTDALEGLEVLHGVSLRHGDVTPDNVLVGPEGRGVLIDLGCALPFGVSGGTLSGTGGFVAPELMEGQAGDAASDLFSVGATLSELHRVAQARPAPALERLIQKLVDPRPGRRPSDVAAVLDALGRRPSGRAVVPLSPRLVGRETELMAFERWLSRVLEREEGPRVLRLYGERGSGTSRLLLEMRGRAESRCPVFRARGGQGDAVTFLFRAATGTEDIGRGANAGILAARRFSVDDAAQVLVIEQAEALSPAERSVVGALALSLAPRSGVGIVLAGGDPLPGVAEQEIVVKPLDVPAVREWTLGALSERALAELVERTGGHPAEIVRALSPFASTARAVGAMPEAVTSGIRTGSAAITRALSLLAARGGVLPLGAFPGPGAELKDLCRAGYLTRQETELRLANPADLGPLEEALGNGPLAAAHAELARCLESGIAPPVARGAEDAERLFHLAASGSADAAEAQFEAHLASFLDEPRAVAPALLGLGERVQDPSVLRGIAEVLLAAQEPRRALSLAARALKLSKGRSPSARGVLADALIRLGKGQGAERVQGPLLGDTSAVGASAWSRVARARLLRGDRTGAAAAAEEGLARDGDPDAVLSLRETRAVAASYLGAPAEAEKALSALLADLGPDADPRDECRLRGQRAIAAFRLGRPERARADHARALEVAERAGLDDLVAVSALNLGTSEHQAGHLAQALESYERGLIVARAAGRAGTELTLLYNLANLRAEIGDVERAQTDLSELSRRALQVGYSHFAPAIEVLLAEIALLGEDAPSAGAHLDAAERALGEEGGPRERAEISLLRTEVALLCGDVAAATDHCRGALQLAERAAAEDLVLRAEALEGVVRSRTGDPEGVSRIVLCVERARRTGQRLLEARFATDLFHACDALGLPDAVRHAEAALRHFDRLAVDLPEHLQRCFLSHPKRAQVSRLTRSARGPRSGHDAEALRRLLSLTRRMNSSLSLERVLDYAVEAAVDLSHAERGFLLLREGETLRVAATRDAEHHRQPPSLGIVRRAIESEAAVLTTDAESDPRFSGHGSVHSMHLKSVLSVPILTPEGALGVLYVDSRVQRGRFTDADRELLTALADQAAIAVVNARLHADMRAQAALLSEQKRTIERLSRGKDGQIVRLKREVDARQRVLEFRYDYSRIVGRGPAMRRVLSELDRICDTSVNVVVRGESGTGKELVARAIHWNGPRREGPFVGINCAALPENLLESELFGHVRGAFTGADRDRAGLLVEAKGGTVFLDEIGELPLSMQAKILRAIQEREVRPLGAARATPLDIRLICATHRDLETEVAEGRFREDLYYRLAVVTVRLPALRERIEDLPALSEAILASTPRGPGQPVKALSRSAWAVLAAHDWPGNVRELENALVRAAVLSTGETIEPADLALGARPRAARGTTRSTFQVEEKERILTLLRGTRWNVSVVSRTLGIPRNTLYRKLKQYGVSRDGG